MDRLTELRKAGALPGPNHPVRKSWKRTDPVRAHRANLSFTFTGLLLMIIGEIISNTMDNKDKATAILVWMVVAGIACFVAAYSYRSIANDFCSIIDRLQIMLHLSAKEICNLPEPELKKRAETRLEELRELKKNSEKEWGTDNYSTRVLKSGLIDAVNLFERAGIA